MFSNAERDIFEPVMLDELMGEGQDLPSLPEVFTRVSEQLDDDNCSLERIAISIQSDPAIASRLLKTVNANNTDRTEQISSVARAVKILGRDRCKPVLLGSVVKGLFAGEDNPAFSMQVYWQHCIKTALIARQLAEAIDSTVDPEVLFTAGLLHDIGKLLLIQRFPREMLAAEKIMIRRRIDELGAELTQLGLTHTAVGEALMKHWGLPDILIECTRCHHEVVHDGPNRQATHLVYLANRLSEYVPPLDDDETLAILGDIENWNMSQVPIEQIARACQLADEQVFEVMESFGMVSFANEGH